MSIGYIITAPGQQGPPGPPGPPGPAGASLLSYTAAIPISGHRIITINSDGKAIYADSTILSHANKVIGMSTGAAAADSTLSVKIVGEFTEGSWNWTPNQPIYLSTNGLITQTVPTSPSLYSLVIGTAVTSTTIFINIMPPIFLI